MRIVALLPVLAFLVSCAGEETRPLETRARWVRTHWSKARREGDGATTNRVNSPDTATGRFKDRPEAKADGKLVFTIAEDPAGLAGAELYLELWGGHPGTANKRFTLNGGATYEIPEVGAAAGHCTYSFPSIPLRLEEFHKGENVFQFSCEKGATFWGHFLFEVAALRLTLRAPPFPFRLEVETAVDGERIGLALGGDLARVASVEYRGGYIGYDENGDGRANDWHGFTKERVPAGIIGTSDTPPFRVPWDISMIPDQNEIACQAVARFKDDPALTCVLSAWDLPILKSARPSVSLHPSQNFPKPFWSRASNAKTCTIELDRDPSTIERAELHVTIWDGGRGTVEAPFTLNGHPLPIAGAGGHDHLYRIVPVDPVWLKKGANDIRVLSDTEHHGIEVLLPGPALIVRARR